MQRLARTENSKVQSTDKSNLTSQSNPIPQNLSLIGKGVRTKEVKEMAEIFFSNPDSVTREEFILFQKVVGYKEATRLLEAGRRRKRQEKTEKPKEQGKNLSQEKSQNKLNIESKVGDPPKARKLVDMGFKSKVEVENDTIKPEKDNLKVKEKTDDRFTKGKIQQNTEKPDSKKHSDLTQKGENKVNNMEAEIRSIENEQGLQTDEKTNTTKGEESGNKLKEKDSEVEKGAKGEVTVKNKEQKDQQSGDMSKAISGLNKTDKNAKKTPQVKIKMGDPNNILEQMVNVPPTQALNAYSQASEVSKASLEKQTQKTQGVLPKISAPTGLIPMKKGSERKNKIKVINREVSGAFKSAKSGGKQGSIRDINVGSGNEPNPEAMMAEARQYSAKAPTISLTGAADPNQADSFNAESSRSVQAAKQEELNQLNNEFGENNIYPYEDSSILKGKPLKAKAQKIGKISKKLDIPADLDSQLNKSLGPEMKKQIGAQKSKYTVGKEKFDKDVLVAKSSSDSKIVQMKADAKKNQQKEQVNAKAEIKRLKGQWKDEIKQTVSEYDKQAEAETKSKTKEISKVKEQKDKEVKAKLAQAEKDANVEYKTAKKNADEKKKEKEKEHANEKKSWLEKAGDWIKEKAKKFVEGLKKVINFIYQGLRKAVKTIFSIAKAAITGLIELGRQLIVNIIKGLGVILKSLVKIVFSKFPKISKKICGFIDKAVSNAVKVVNNIANTLKKGVSSVLDFLSNTLDKLLGAVQSLFNGIFTFIGMIISGKFAEIMARIKFLGEAAKKSLSHIEAAVWKQLLGRDVTKSMGNEEPEGISNVRDEKTVNEKLTEADVEIEHVERGEADPALLAELNLKDGETKYVGGSKDPETIESVIRDFDNGKNSEKAASSSIDRGKILDQIKGFVIKWLKDNWVKLLLGILGALAGIIALEIVTGGAITAALPVIMNVLNAVMAVSIADAIATAAGYVETYLTEGWAGHVPIAAKALAAALAIGLVELVMALGFKVIGAGLKSVGKVAKTGVKTVVRGTKNLGKLAGKGISSLLKSGVKLSSKSGKYLVKNGKLVIKSIQKGFTKGAKKLKDLTNRILNKFKFKGLEFERKGSHLLIFGIFNPKKLIADLKIKEESKKMATKPKYTTTIKWGINNIEVRPFGKGFFGKRIAQKNLRVDNFELKINPNNESFYLQHPKGGYVQFENLAGDILQDGKLIMKQKSFYHVEDLPKFAQDKVIKEAMRQIESASVAGYKVEWLVSDEKAVEQLTRLFKKENIDITVRYYRE